MNPSRDGIKLVAENRKARFNYTIDESLECGVELVGTEVKSVREGRISFQDAFVHIKNNELIMQGFHISVYKQGSLFNHNPDRDRKLLAHKEEIKKLKRKVDEKGFTLVPLKIYFSKGKVKIELGICKGKKMYDKSDAIKERDMNIDARREMRER
jgi:SsrA-binding protein